MGLNLTCGMSWKLITQFRIVTISTITMQQQVGLSFLLPIWTCLRKILNYTWTYPPFWKHAPNSMFNNSFRNSLLQLSKCLHRHTTRSSRVSSIKLLSPLFPRYSNLFCIYLSSPKLNNKQIQTWYGITKHYM